MDTLNLPTNELAELARAEAANFALPENWHQGRAHRRSFAIDEPYSPDIDDAIAYSDEMLHVSIADVGSFLMRHEAIRRYARRRAWSLYEKNRVVAPMIPRKVSEDKMSLLDDVERPVLTVHVPLNIHNSFQTPEITRDVIRAQRLTYAEVNKGVGEKTEMGVALRGLERVARLLFAARHTDANPEEAVLEDEEGNMLAMDDYSTGQLIVQESMIAANTAMARYILAHNIPAIFRNHIVPEEVPEIGDPAERAQLIQPMPRANYALEPKGHAGLKLPAYVHFTSPIRRFPDFVNHANVVAYLEGRSYPYPQGQLRQIVERLQMLSLKEVQQQRVGRGRHRRVKNTQSERSSHRYRTVEYLLVRFADETATPIELATAIFNAIGSEEEVTAVRVAAAEYAAKHIQLARPALNAALAQKFLTLRPTQKKEQPSVKAKFALEDAQGNVYPYLTKTSSLSMAVNSVHTIGSICGVHVEPMVPAAKTHENRILQDGYRHLRKLANEGRFRLITHEHSQQDGSIYIGLMVIMGTTRHVAGVNAASKRQALRGASAQLIKELDLIDNPPPKAPAQQKQEAESDPHENPIVCLHARQGTAGASQAVYSFSKKDPDYTCTATVTDVDGRPYQALAIGKNLKEAQRYAAADLLQQMPKRPLNKRGKMY